MSVRMNNTMGKMVSARMNSMMGKTMSSTMGKTTSKTMSGLAGKMMKSATIPQVYLTVSRYHLNTFLF